MHGHTYIKIVRVVVRCYGKEYGGSRQQRVLSMGQLASQSPLLPKSCMASVFNPKVLSECL